MTANGAMSTNNRPRLPERAGMGRPNDPGHPYMHTCRERRSGISKRVSATPVISKLCTAPESTLFVGRAMSRRRSPDHLRQSLKLYSGKLSQVLHKLTEITEIFSLAANPASQPPTPTATSALKWPLRFCLVTDAALAA